MSYFDHAHCPSCGADFDPEQVVPRGDGFSCPACGAQLGMSALFGLRAAFEEEPPPDVTLNDLVPGAPAPAPAAPSTTLPARRQTPTEGQETALDILNRLRRQR